MSALQQAIEEIRAEIANKQRVLDTLLALVAGDAAPVKRKVKAARVPKNGGGSRVVKKDAEPAPVDGAPKKYRKVCEKHGAYSASGPRQACPACNPRVVTAKDRYAED